MKHTVHATIFLLMFFLLTQIIGLFLIAESVDVVKFVDDEGNQVSELIQVDDVSRPEFEYEWGSLVWILSGVLIGTGILLLLQKFKKPKIWKYWFLMAVITAIYFALQVVLNNYLAFFIASSLALMKIFHKQVFLHNLTEILMYSGIGVLIAPVFNLFWVSMLLVIISFYDMFAVWKSKHMVKMAKFMSQTTFAGLMLPYNSKGANYKGKLSSSKIGEPKNSGNQVAILGGGDVAFPLIFSGVVLRYLVIDYGFLPSYLFALLVSLFAAIALGMLLIFGKKHTFYPAMPFISAGCFIGLAIVFLLVNIF